MLAHSPIIFYFGRKHALKVLLWPPVEDDVTLRSTPPSPRVTHRDVFSYPHPNY
jgi:hypothetical protein